MNPRVLPYEENKTIPSAAEYIMCISSKSFMYMLVGVYRKGGCNMFVPANISDSNLADYSPYLEFWHSMYINGCSTSNFWCNTFIL